MVAAVGIDAPQGGSLVVYTANAVGLDVVQAMPLAIYNIPAKNIRAQFAGINVLYSQVARNIAATAFQTMAVVRGRMDNPRLRAWTFSLDGHDFYVLRLGEDTTLIYDLYSEQWVDWASLNIEFWRANIGINWPGGMQIAGDYGSNVLVGDDTYGLLWFLDPNQPYDEDPDDVTDENQYFERIVTGQVSMRGRNVLPCYACWLTTDMGAPAYTGAGVTLYTSDDGGANYDDQGTVTVTLDENSPELSWYSLGQIGAPGRLFKLVDDGAIARIDGLEMNDE